MPKVSRVTVRERKDFRLGRNVVLCSIGPNKKPYRVHADLLCKSSTFFRKALQAKRRVVEGDCSICHEEMGSNAEELTYCSAHCGVNFHFLCLEKWKSQAASQANCPLCRHAWKGPSYQRQTLTNIEESGFELYTEWLYHRRLSAEYDFMDNYCEDLVKAYVAGTHFEDSAFCNAVLHAMVETCVDSDDYPGLSVVDLAYSLTSDSCSLRSLLVDIYKNMDKEKFSVGDVVADQSKEFLVDLATSFMEQGPPEKKDCTLANLKNVPTLQPLDDDTEDECLVDSDSEGDSEQD